MAFKPSSLLVARFLRLCRGFPFGVSYYMYILLVLAWLLSLAFSALFWCACRLAAAADRLLGEK